MKLRGFCRCPLAPLSCSNSQDLVAFEAPQSPLTRIPVGGRRLEPSVQDGQFSYWCCHRLGTNKSEHKARYNLIPMFNRMINNLQLINVTADHW